MAFQSKTGAPSCQQDIVPTALSGTIAKLENLLALITITKHCLHGFPITMTNTE